MRDDGLPGRLERVDGGVLRGVGRVVEPQVDEQAIVAVGRGRAERLAIDGDDALAVLAGGLGEELLEPGAEVVDAGRGDERQLVDAPRGRARRGSARARRRGSRRRARGRAGVHHAVGARRAARSTSSPITAAGTMPKFDSAE